MTLTPLSDAVGSVFPESHFRLDARPSAMRSVVANYRTFATRASDVVEELGELTLDQTWTGEGGDMFRASRTRYSPLMTDAQIAFTGVHREITALADTIELAMRRLDSLRPTARMAWDQWQIERARTLTLSLTPPFGSPLLTSFPRDEQQEAEKRFRALVDEAQRIHEQVARDAEATAQKLAALPLPAPIPRQIGTGTLPSSTPYAVWSTSGHAWGLLDFKMLLAGQGLEVEFTQLSDGTWEATLSEEADLGLEWDWDLYEFKATEAVSSEAGGGAKGMTGATQTAIFTGKTPEEIMAKMLQHSVTGGISGADGNEWGLNASMSATLAATFTGAVEPEPEFELTAAEEGATYEKSVEASVSTRLMADGTSTTTLSWDQGVSWGVFAAVGGQRVAESLALTLKPGGGAVVTRVTKTKDESTGTITEETREVDVDVEEAAKLARTVDAIVGPPGSADAGLASVAETLDKVNKLEATSPEVLTGEARYSSIEYESTTAEIPLAGKILGVGGEGGIGYETTTVRGVEGGPTR
ncbi:MAG: hypothetical protein Q4G43_01635 [Mobilicoccus sp.]|nr:hypothetical protein [Mobilicoccus sp.]